METIYKIDIAIIGISIVLLMALLGYAQPLVISPLSGYETTSTDVLFKIEKAEKILIDDNQAFETPEEYTVGEGLIITLKPGTYYWKAEGILQSEINELTIQTNIDLQLRKKEEGIYEVTNAGNTEVEVEVYDNEGITERFGLTPTNKKEVNGKYIQGGMK